MLRYITHFQFTLLLCSLLLTSVTSASSVATKNFSEREDVLQFIDDMASKHDFNREELKSLFDGIRPRPDIIEAISNPAEALPWFKYRPIFLKPARISGGVKFWEKYADILAQAEWIYGVPAEIIVAIIGVETRYGTYKGKHPIMESLTTLAFDYPKRSRFFRSELEQYLLLTREENINPLSLKGSYAGAMGGPQFISSSYRRYAVDFDNDGKRNLWNNWSDIIGSVANYFSVHGWEKGAPVTSRANVKGNHISKLVKLGIKPKHTLSYLIEKGVQPSDSLPVDKKAALIRLETKNSTEYWVGLRNFYVITRYNHSQLYAMAVYQLSREILAERKKLAKSSQVVNN